MRSIHHERRRCREKGRELDDELDLGEMRERERARQHEDIL